MQQQGCLPVDVPGRCQEDVVNMALQVSFLRTTLVLVFSF
jgi:hypothetical protein